jgi:adenylate cyclase
MRNAEGFDRVEPSPGAASAVRFAGLVLNVDACRLLRESGAPIALTRGEFALLRMFVSRPGRVISRDSLLDAFSDRRFEPFDRSIDVLVGRLRKKIEADPKQPRLIVTVPGEGYRFDGLTPSLSSEQKPSAAVQALQEDGEHDEDRESDAPVADQPTTFAATNEAAPPTLEQRTDTPISERPLDEPLSMSEAETDGDGKRRVTAFAANADDAQRAARKKRSTLLPLALGAAAFLVLIGGAAWWFVNADAPAAVASKVAPDAARLSLVVLPFTNLSNDPSQDYFADGVTDNLTTELSHLHNSFVIARNTAFTFKGKTLDSRAIGKELGVRYVLEGSVQRDANRVRINAQLIDAETGAHLWADRFEDDVVDLFKLQDEVVARLARTLQVELMNAEARRSLHDHPQNPDAVDLTMRGFAVFNQSFGKANDYEARGLFDQALALDPKNADALAGAASADVGAYANGWYDQTAADVLYARAAERTNQALLLNPDQASAHYTKALLVMFKANDPVSANQVIAESEATLRADPTFAGAYLPMAVAEGLLGHYEQAISGLREAMRISPRDSTSGVWHMEIGRQLLALGRDDDAIQEALKAVDLGYHTVLSYTALAAFYAAADKMPEAKAALAEAMELNPKLSVAWFRAHNSAWVDTPPGFREALVKAGLPEG